MKKTIESLELDVVDLGAASAETKGPPFGPAEIEGRLPEGGLSDD
jgi:hypothetical protein